MLLILIRTVQSRIGQMRPSLNIRQVCQADYEIIFVFLFLTNWCALQVGAKAAATRYKAASASRQLKQESLLVKD